jgi:hypothetical protein
MKRLLPIVLPLLAVCASPVARGAEPAAEPSARTIEASSFHPDSSGWISASQPFSASSTVTITWGGCSWPDIYVSMDGNGPQLFASGTSGSQNATWIQLDHVYQFTMYCGGSPVATTDVLGVGYESAGIGALPREVRVPAGGLGSTEIFWGVNQHPFGWVTVSMDGAAEQLFASGVQGSQWANWIQPGHSYVFRVYEAYFNQPVTWVTVTGIAD